MTSFISSRLGAIRRWITSRPADGDAPPLAHDERRILDGLSAAVLCESMFTPSAFIGGAFPASAMSRAWSGLAQSGARTFSGRAVGAETLKSAEEAIAAAMGAALSGERSCAMVAPKSATGWIDAASQARDLGAPMVITLVNTAAGGAGEALGTGHEAIEAARAAGMPVWVATCVQDVVDLLPRLRWIAEQSLQPVVLAMDLRETALAAQDVALPNVDAIREHLGDHSELIESPSESQRIVFGHERRRVPRRHDVDRPAMLGPHMDAEVHALSRIGRLAYLRPDLLAAISGAAEHFGHAPEAMLLDHVQDGELVLVGQGSIVEQLRSTANHLRTERKLKVGVIGLRQRFPLSADDIAKQCPKAKRIVVLERVLTADGSPGPLATELAGAFAPPVLSVAAGVSGSAVSGSDLLALADMIAESDSAKRQRVLGVSFDSADDGAFPHRQALVDELRRAAPNAKKMAIRGTGPAMNLAPNAKLIGAVHEPSDPSSSLALPIAAILGASSDSAVRSRSMFTWRRHAGLALDVAAVGLDPGTSPADDAPINLLLLEAAAGELESPIHAADDLNVVLPVYRESTGRMRTIAPLPRRAAEAMGRPGATVHAVAFDEPRRHPALRVEIPHRSDVLMGGALRIWRESIVSAESPVGSLDAEAAAERFDRWLEEHGVAASERAERIAALRRGWNEVETIDAEQILPRRQRTFSAERLGTDRLRATNEDEQTLGNLPRFWGQIGGPFREAGTAHLTPDPMLAMGDLPALSAALGGVTARDDFLPAFDPQSYNGTGALWTSCPNNSIAPLVITPKALLDAGMELARKAGSPADALRPVLNKLVKAMHGLIRKSGGPPETAGALIQLAYEETARSGGVSGDVTTAISAVIDAVGELPIARTNAFYDDAELEKTGTGALLSIAVDPDACRSPRLIHEACGRRGVRLVDRTQIEVEKAKRIWTLWQSMPDVPAETIERVAKHEDVGPLAAAMLSRHCRFSLAAGDHAEPASGARIALSRILALTERTLQPHVASLLDRINRQRSALGDRIREQMTSAMPEFELDGLAKNLESMDRTDVRLSELSAMLEGGMSAGRMDRAELTRLVELGRRLEQLAWRLEEGPTGRGRARASIVLAGEGVASWAAVFPDNAFEAPVCVDRLGHAAAIARGVWQGHASPFVAAVRLIRRAQAELDGETKPAALAAIERLTINDLTEQERRWLPPLFIIADGSGLSQDEVSDLLELSIPLRLIVLSDQQSPGSSPLTPDVLGAGTPQERTDLALLATLSRRAFVGQTSIAHLAEPQFVQAVTGALESHRPSLVLVHAPSPERHGFPPHTLFDHAALAVRSRAVPLFTYDPEAPGVFGSRIDLSANPHIDKLWVPGPGHRSLTPLDWSAGQARFAHHFHPTSRESMAGASFDRYWGAAPADRPGMAVDAQAPDPNDDRSTISMRADRVIVDDAMKRTELWQTLRELAGIETPFTKRIQAEAETKSQAAIEQERSAFQHEKDQALADLQASADQDAIARVRDHLLEMAGFITTPAQGSAESSGREDA